MLIVEHTERSGKIQSTWLIMILGEAKERMEGGGLGFFNISSIFF
jgi:hypothetical protein